MKILSIIIPVYNKFNFTKACLNDLSKLPNDHEIIIIDNGSTDNTEKELFENKDIIYHRFNENQGFAKACNKGYSIATSSNVLFLNNDIRVKSNHDSWTKPLIEKCDSALVGPTMGQLDNELNFIQEANKVLSGKSYMSGWCLASSKKIWNKLDMSGNNEIFSEEFFCYFEDTDLSFRARQLEIKMEVVDVPVVHFGKQTSNQLNTYQLYKNARQIFIKKWRGKK
jgi:GT2 family glycosyltransferase